MEPNAVVDHSQRRLDGLGTVATVAAQLVKALLLLLNGTLHGGTGSLREDQPAVGTQV